MASFFTFNSEFVQATKNQTCLASARFLAVVQESFFPAKFNKNTDFSKIIDYNEMALPTKAKWSKFKSS